MGEVSAWHRFSGPGGLEDSERDVKIGEEEVEDAYSEGSGRVVWMVLREASSGG